MRLSIDLNADLGEGYGNYNAGDDQALLPFVSSANVACGFHAGDPRVMEATVRSAAALGVAVGAHPGYPDLVGFGRRQMDATPLEVYTDVLYQIGALAAFCRAAGVSLRHVKAHGALYNRAAVDEATAAAIVKAVRAFSRDLPLVSQPASALYRLAREADQPVMAEQFADRAVQADGNLVARRAPGALILEPERAAARAVQMVSDRTMVAIDGSLIACEVDTICIHGDMPGAVERARAIRQALEAAGIVVMAPMAAG
jgi:UPF0271 protein